MAFNRSRVSDDSDAEDILQEVFFRIHRNLCCSTQWDKPESWVYQITRILIIDYYRRWRESVEITDDLPAGNSIPEDNPDLIFC